MRYLIILLLVSSCAGSYTLRTDYGTYRHLQKEHVVDISYQLDSLADSGSHTFILYKKKFMGRDYLMSMMDTIPRFFIGVDSSGNEYTGKNLWFLRKYINNKIN